MMWKRSVHLIGGLLLLTIAGYFILRTANEWKAHWQREVDATVREAEAVNSNSAHKTDDDITAAAKLQVYGVLSQPSSAATEPDEAAVRPADTPPGFDHVNQGPTGAAMPLLHRRFSVRSYQAFVFEVPAHAAHPRVHGSFKSYTKNPGPSVSSAAVDVLLLQREEFSAFVLRGLGTAAFSVPDSDGAQIDWLLNPTFLNPQKYYLVFHNSSGNPRVKGVEADFTISYE
jgi:hypothetical protein